MHRRYGYIVRCDKLFYQRVCPFQRPPHAIAAGVDVEIVQNTSYLSWRESKKRMKKSVRHWLECFPLVGLKLEKHTSSLSNPQPTRGRS
jgi:hypothetical protein